MCPPQKKRRKNQVIQILFISKDYNMHPKCLRQSFHLSLVKVARWIIIGLFNQTLLLLWVWILLTVAVVILPRHNSSFITVPTCFSWSSFMHLLKHLSCMSVTLSIYVAEDFKWNIKQTFPPLSLCPQPQREATLEAHVKANSPLTLRVGEVEEQTQDKQQRQQQRGPGSVHGGTAWHQHALAASVALAHRALWVSLVWFLRCRVFTAYVRQGGMGRGRKKREKEREELNETKLFGSSGFIYPCTFLTYPHTASAGADRG